MALPCARGGSVSEVRIEAPDVETASNLVLRLAVGAELVARQGRCELSAEVSLAELPHVLSIVDAWMGEAGIGSVAVRLDERRYVLVRR